jgi:hypothetical protein
MALIIPYTKGRGKGKRSFPYIKNMTAIIKNMAINGSNTKNHETPVYPFLHSRFKIHVQNNTYKNLIKNIT